MLKVQHVHKSFKNSVFLNRVHQAVSDVSFTLEKGSVLGLAGSSGCGKTTLSRIILHALKADSGHVLYEGKDVALLGRAGKKQYHREVQIIFQNPEASMNPSQRVLENLLEPMLIHHIGASKRERTDKICELMGMVGLSEHLLSHYPHQISGGEAQRLSICRALTIQPKLLILDEPTSMLDVSVQAHVMTLLKELKKRLDLTYLYISHDIDLHKWFTDELMIMNQGKIIERGHTGELLNTPKQKETRELLRSFHAWDEVKSKKA